MSDPQQSAQNHEAVLEGWKAIAGHLNRDVRTAKRWEVSEGLPIHRHRHSARSSVYAYRAELDAWRASRRPEARGDAEPPKRRATRPLALAATMVLALATAGGGAVRSAFPAEGPVIVSKQIWNGPGADRFGSVSPDGRYLSYMDSYTGDLAIYDIANASGRRITNNPGGFKEFAEFSVFSADATRLAYGWQTAAGQYELRFVPRSGGEPKVLVAKTAWLRPYGFSPDSQHVLSLIARENRTRQLVLVSVVDGTSRVVKTLEARSGVPDRAEFSPDGRYIAFDRRSDAADSDVFLIAADGSGETLLVGGSSNESFLGWFPDGRSLLFLSDRLGAPSVWSISFEKGAPVGEPRLVKSDIGRIVPKGFTRDGSFFYHLTVGMADIFTASMDLATGTATEPLVPLRGRTSTPRIGATWSPDGSRIAYRVNQSMTVGIHDYSTGAVQTLPLKLSTASAPGVWAPDGRALIMTGSQGKEGPGIYRVEIPSGEVSLLGVRQSGLMGAPAVSRDGKRLYYRRNLEAPPASPQTSVYVYDIEAREERKIFTPTDRNVVAVLLSPDDRWLAMRIQNGDGTRSLEVLPASGGTPRVILRDKIGEVAWGGLAWTTDGDALLIVREGSLWQVDIADGSLRKMNIAVPGMNRISLHPDGRRLAIGSADLKGEIWALENLAAALRQ